MAIEISTYRFRNDLSFTLEKEEDEMAIPYLKICFGANLAVFFIIEDIESQNLEELIQIFTKLTIDYKIANREIG